MSYAIGRARAFMDTARAFIARRSSPAALRPEYRDDPLGYARDVLKVRPTPDHERAIELLMRPPRRLLLPSGNSVGKSFLDGWLVNWWFDTRSPGICITTAPSQRQVESILWKEVRTQRHRAGLPRCFAGPKIPRMETSPDHYAFGFTARDAISFKGHHSPGGILLIIDEAEGIDHDMISTVGTMLDDNSYLVCTYNPTGGPTTAMAEAERKAYEHGAYKVHHFSCLNHPNIKSQEAGGPAVIPGAITLDQLRLMMLDDSTPLGDTDEPQEGDVTLAGQRYRPGPIAQAQCLGIRPTTSTAGVWSEALWKRMLSVRHEILPRWPVAIGCDVARYGDNRTTIWVRKGLCVLHGETHSKLSTKDTARKLREACHRFSDPANPEKTIPCMIDEGGIGGGVMDQADGYLFVGVNAGHAPRDPKRFTNVRAELWFTARDHAVADAIDVSRIPVAILSQLRQELLSTLYEVVPGKDKMRVSAKEDSVDQLRRSPDLADGFNLALYPPAANRVRAA